MRAILSSLLLGLKQVFEPACLRILVKSALVTLVVFAVVATAAWFALDWALARVGWGDGDFAGAADLRGAASALITLAAMWLVWRIVAMLVIQFFADEVVHAVEAQHYPLQAERARKLTMGEQARHALGAGGRALLANLIALPIALVLVITGIGPAVVFLLVNAVLLGREFQDMVWLRHQTDKAAPAPLAKRERLLLGGVVAGLMMVPFAQLIAPLLGAASATHLVHRRGRVA